MSNPSSHTRKSFGSGSVPQACAVSTPSHLPSQEKGKHGPRHSLFQIPQGPCAGFPSNIWVYTALHDGGTQGPWPSSTVIFPVPQVLAWPQEAPDCEKNLVHSGSWARVPSLPSPLWPEFPKPTGRLCAGQQEPSICPPTSLAGALVGFPRCPLPWSKGQGLGWGSVEVALAWRTRAPDSRGVRRCNNSNQGRYPQSTSMHLGPVLRTSPATGRKMWLLDPWHPYLHAPTQGSVSCGSRELWAWISWCCGHSLPWSWTGMEGSLCLSGSPLQVLGVGASLSLEEGRALSQGPCEDPAAFGIACLALFPPSHALLPFAVSWLLVGGTCPLPHLSSPLL